MNPIQESEKYDVEVRELGWTIFAIKVKVLCPHLLLPESFRFPARKGQGVLQRVKMRVTHSMANLNLSSRVLISS